MLTVAEVAQQTGRSPETVRRWIRSGHLPARKGRTYHLVDEDDLAELLGPDHLAVPEAWQTTAWGAPIPDVVKAVRDSRQRRAGAEG